MEAPRIGITVGDPAGIGPEIVLASLEMLKDRISSGEMTITVIGSAAPLLERAHHLGKSIELGDWDGHLVWPRISFFESTCQIGPVPLGAVSAEAGRQAYYAVEKAVELAGAQKIQAIVTAPLNKEALNLAGFQYTGHTDLLAKLTGCVDSCMMLAHGNLRVTHLSTHVSLARVPALLTRARLDRVLSLTFEALARLGIDSGRVAVAALNPHAGEGGIFGREDILVTTPAIAAWRENRYDVVGPIPGDTVFVKAVAGQFDAVVAMYHDQGHIPIKLLGFRIDAQTNTFADLSGVNVTLGLPLIRTSVDHGTAFDIAGQGTANPQSLMEAIDYALMLVQGPKLAGPRGPMA